MITQLVFIGIASASMEITQTTKANRGDLKNLIASSIHCLRNEHFLPGIIVLFSHLLIRTHQSYKRKKDIY